MKKVFLALCLVCILSISAVAVVKAQTPVPACPIPTTGAVALGLTCGIPDDPCIKKCCAFAPQNNTRAVNLPVITDVLNFLGVKDPLDPLNQLSYQAQSYTQPCLAGGVPTTPGDLSNPACVCINPTGTPLNELTKMCDNITNSGEITLCKQCLTGGGAAGTVGVWSGIGCIYSNVGTFIQETLLGWGVGFAGGISMLCIIYAAIMMQTSGGNAEKVKKAQQLMTSCITGLMIIIVSVFILQLIGVRILRIPGFNM